MRGRTGGRRRSRRGRGRGRSWGKGRRPAVLGTGPSPLPPPDSSYRSSPTSHTKWGGGRGRRGTATQTRATTENRMRAQEKLSGENPPVLHFFLREARKRERDIIETRMAAGPAQVLLSPEYVLDIKDHVKHTGMRPRRKGRRGRKTDQDTENSEINKRHPETKAKRRKQVASSSPSAPPSPRSPTKSSPGLGLDEGPGPKDGDQRMQSVGATGEQGEPQAHSCCPPSLQPRSCREKGQHKPGTFQGSPLPSLPHPPREGT